ncbi:uncharacterized protein LOC134257022 [Saccostrea cucullata]|uniref:uncharacterized protein LOC134257022 n=1 Tax=Saccostrea cuccullata TaxID=36930 RepID=UPI002ED12D7D
MIISDRKDIEHCRQAQKSTESEIRAVIEINSSLQESVTDLKARSMRDNLVFTGIREHAWENTEQVLQDFLQRKYRLEYPLDFDRVHRMGKFNEFSELSRKIVAKFSFFKDKDHILSNAVRRLRGIGVFVNEQFPPEIEEKRKKLYPVMKQAKLDHKRTKLVCDKLFINGKEYIPQENAPVFRSEWNSESAPDQINRTPKDRNLKRARVSSTPDK